MFDGNGTETRETIGTSSEIDTNSRWRQIDRRLRAIAKKRAALDADEACWLREAERVRIWERTGYSSMRAYLESLFGYSPGTANDRMRVARELETLPLLTAALTNGRAVVLGGEGAHAGRHASDRECLV